MDPSALDTFRAFRNSLYNCLHRRADALFELTDALLTAEALSSPVHLSLEPSHRRGWGSLYDALSRGRIDAQTLRRLLAYYPLGGSETTPPVYAVDVSVWDRCDAECSPERGFYYHPSRHSAGQPIVAGWAYQFIAQLNFVRDSWVAPTDARRVRPEDDANEVAVAQVKDLLHRQPGPAGEFDVNGNKLHDNTGACPATAETPALSGVGIGLLGARDVEVHGNQILDNVPSNPQAFSGGVLAVRGIEGTPPMNNTVMGNTILGNEPDIFWDESGSGNRFKPNNCETSVPGGLCKR